MPNNLQELKQNNIEEIKIIPKGVLEKIMENIIQRIHISSNCNGEYLTFYLKYLQIKYKKINYVQYCGFYNILHYLHYINCGGKVAPHFKN